MERGDVLRLLRKKLPPEEFTRRYGDLFIVRALFDGEADLRAFETNLAVSAFTEADLAEIESFVEPKVLPAGLSLVEQLKLAPSKFALHALVKTPRANPWPGIVFLGRAASADIVINHESISKMHCCFRREPETGPDARWYVQELRSKNGTRAGGRKVGQDEPGAPIADGDKLLLGDLGCQMCAADALTGLWWT